MLCFLQGDNTTYRNWRQGLILEPNDTPAKGFEYFTRYFESVHCIQLVKNLKREKTYVNKLEIRSLIPWLADFSLRKCNELTC